MSEAQSEKAVLELVPEVSGDKLVGTLVNDRYRIVDVIGQGAMGIVYEAIHEALQRPSALKVLGPAWASDEEAIIRFQREARTASNLGHPYIVTIYDFGRLEDGRPFLAMERLRGESLADALARDGALSAERTARIVRQIADALDAVHDEALVHRDIKPDNVFLARRSGSTETVQLLDFGLAAFALPGEGRTRVTRQGQIHGTPCYMAPEAASGEIPPDHRADIYSLAVVAFEMLSGALPFDNPNPMQVLTAKMSTDAPSMFTASGRSFPSEVEEVIAKSLARHPDMRHETARELADALEQALSAGPAGESTAAAAPTQPRPLSEPPEIPVSPFFRKLRPVVAVAVLVALAIAGFMVFGGDTAPEEEIASAAGEPPSSSPSAPAEPAPAEGSTAPEDEVAEDEVAPEGEEAAEAEAPDAAAASAEAEAPADDVEEREETEAREEPTATRPSEMRASRRGRRGRTRPEPSPSPATEPATPEPAVDVSALSREGTQALVRGQLSVAIEKFRQVTRHAPRNARAWRSLGFAYERLGRRGQAARAYRRYLEIAPSAPDASSVRERLQGLDG